MNRIRMGVAALTLLLGLDHSPSSAQSCAWLNSENQRLRREATALAQYEWGSAIVFGGCLVVGMDAYNQSGREADALTAVSVCAAAGCGLTTDYRNCLAVNASLFLYALRGSLIEDQISRRCRY